MSYAISLAGYSDKHGLSPEKWDLPVPSWAIADDQFLMMIKTNGKPPTWLWF